MRGEPAWRAEAEAHKRAMPMSRLLGNGMERADAMELYRLVDDGVPWAEAAERLGDRDLTRAERAAAAGHVATARSWFRYASACYRFGQVPLTDDDPVKHRMYRGLVSAYGDAARLHVPPIEHVALSYDGGTLCGWLWRPANVERPPAVIVFGGVDGWREEYHCGAAYLVERGVAVFLVDGPGQGESRLSGHLYAAAGIERAYSAFVDLLLADDRIGDRIGIWGNSFGGHVAALTAAADDRIAACCAIGGSDRPVEVLDRYPRFAPKFQLFTGLDDLDEAVETISRFVLDSDRLSHLRCPLLVLHAVPDRIFLVEGARRLVDRAGATDKRLVEWPDGDHCIYNHSHEKHVMVADWFAERLAAKAR